MVSKPRKTFESFYLDVYVKHRFSKTLVNVSFTNIFTFMKKKFAKMLNIILIIYNLNMKFWSMDTSAVTDHF